MTDIFKRWWRQDNYKQGLRLAGKWNSYGQQKKKRILKKVKFAVSF